MRHLLPALLLCAALAVGAAPAVAKQRSQQGPAKRPAKRLRSHVSLHVSKHHVVSGRRVVLRGRVRPRGGRRVKIVVRGPDGTVGRTGTGRGGRFAVRWTPREPGIYRIRAYGRHSRRMRGAVSVARRVTAYRHAEASYYGPGLYGGPLACGGTLWPETLGVAHRTLPCGSPVRLLYEGRVVQVEVVDRGPYVAGREFDLTAATRARLGFPSTGVLLASK